METTFYLCKIELCHFLSPCIVGVLHYFYDTVFASFQVATILANMSAIEQCCIDISEQHGVALLVQFLMEEVPSGNNKGNYEAESAACERVQQKAAIALTRLARDPDNAQLVVELQGE